MQESQISKAPIVIQIESIAYFLAGSIAIDSGTIIQSADKVLRLQIVNWVIFIVGAILILSSVVYLLSTFTFITALREKLLLRKSNLRNLLAKFGISRFLQFQSWINILLIIFLFSITFAQVITTILANLNVTPLSISYSVFLFILLISILYGATAKRLRIE
jgi:hypothetical protein